MPGRMYPSDGPRPTSSDAERHVYSALKDQLPAGWTAWHSLRVRTRGNVEGEGDFVIAIPGRGFLVLEVKGGAIRVQAGHWLQNDKQMDAAPLSQAHRFARALQEKCEERKAPSRFAVAVAFPDVPFDKPPSEGNLDHAVLGAQDMPHLGRALPLMVEHLFANLSPPSNTEWVAALHNLWCETWVPRLSLGSRTRVRRAEIVRMDRSQLELLSMFDESHRLLVQGGPGTGKTLVARETYRRLKAAGRKPLLLCFTHALAAGLRKEGLENAWTTGECAANALQRAGVALQNGAPQAEWTPETWKLAPLQAVMDAADQVRAGVDAVIVDEGQDLPQDDWELAKCAAGDGFLWCFADRAQGFWADRAVPTGMFPGVYTLMERYRCPETLARFADQYRPATTGMVPPPEGAFPELRVVRLPSKTAVDEYVGTEIAKALGDGATPGDVAVLSLGGTSRSELRHRARIGGQPVVPADADNATDHVVLDTFLRFKGLERPWVIITELGLGVHQYDLRMHIALTRATVGCVVVGLGPELESDPRLLRASGKAKTSQTP